MLCAKNIFYLLKYEFGNDFGCYTEEKTQLNFIPVWAEPTWAAPLCVASQTDLLATKEPFSSYQSKTLCEIYIYQKCTDFFEWCVPKIAHTKWSTRKVATRESKRGRECPTFVLFALNISCNPVKCISWVTFVYRGDIHAMKVLEWLY